MSTEQTYFADFNVILPFFSTWVSFKILKQKISVTETA